MGLANFFTKIFAGGATGIITGIADTADRFIQTPEEKAIFKLEVMNYEMEMKRLIMQGEQEYAKDRQNAREMYMKDSSLQKIFAIVFLVGYIFLSTSMVVIVFGFFGVGLGSNMEPFQASLISMVFTAMSTKINTITDFLFGGSKKQDDSGEKISTAFEGGIK